MKYVLIRLGNRGKKRRPVNPGRSKESCQRGKERKALLGEVHWSEFIFWSLCSSLLLKLQVFRCHSLPLGTNFHIQKSLVICFLQVLIRLELAAGHGGTRACKLQPWHCWVAAQCYVSACLLDAAPQGTRPCSQGQIPPMHKNEERLASLHLETEVAEKEEHFQVFRSSLQVISLPPFKGIFKISAGSCNSFVTYPDVLTVSHRFLLVLSSGKHHGGAEEDWVSHRQTISRGTPKMKNRRMLSSHSWGLSTYEAPMPIKRTTNNFGHFTEGSGWDGYMNGLFALVHSSYEQHYTGKHKKKAVQVSWASSTTPSVSCS